MYYHRCAVHRYLYTTRELRAVNTARQHGYPVHGRVDDRWTNLFMV